MNIDQIRDEFEMLESAIEDGPIVPNVTAGEIRAYLGSRFDFKQTMTLDDVVCDVEQMLRKWQVQVTHPRYFGLYNPSVTLASVVADTLVAMYNSQLANWRTSPAANEMERHTLASWAPSRARSSSPAAVPRQTCRLLLSLSPGPFRNMENMVCGILRATRQSISPRKRITASTRSRTWQAWDDAICALLPPIRI